MNPCSRILSSTTLSRSRRWTWFSRRCPCRTLWRALQCTRMLWLAATTATTRSRSQLSMSVNWQTWLAKNQYLNKKMITGWLSVWERSLKLMKAWPHTTILSLMMKMKSLVFPSTPLPTRAEMRSTLKLKYLMSKSQKSPRESLVSIKTISVRRPSSKNPSLKWLRSRRKKSRKEPTVELKASSSIHSSQTYWRPLILSARREMKRREKAMGRKNHSRLG